MQKKVAELKQEKSILIASGGVMSAERCKGKINKFSRFSSALYWIHISR